MEREEGELTDEDLEDVSDNSSELSIPIALTGKSPLREPFREISLTSISDDSDSLLLEKTSYRHISRDLYRKHSQSQSHKHRRDDKSSTKRARRCFADKRKQRRTSLHRKDYSSVSSSSDDSNYKNKTILRQLRDAVRINRSQNLPNCSLRTRLKRMIEPASQTSNSSDDDNLEILRDQALQSKTKIDPNAKDAVAEATVNDEDLAQLRLIALKSAVIKKHAERRKRKEEQLKLEQKNAAENDENVTQQVAQQQPNNIEANATTPINQLDQLNQSIEEDEDILRAMLLTSISKKIADKKTVKQHQANHLNGAALQKPHEKKNNYKLPAVPLNRFIIKVNSDSETDSEQNDAAVEKKPLTSPKNDIFDKSLSLFLQQARAKTEEEITKRQSDISHLPRSQQIEYKRLKRKLQILSTRMKPATSMNNNKMKKMSPPDENKKVPNTNMNTNANANTNTYINNKFVAKCNNPVAEKARPDDRLMIKGKYEELTPLMSRVSEARIARDKTQADVKRLINNLKIARAQLTANHQEYTVLVQELVKAKTDIDKRAENQEKNNKIRTSTPKKLTIKENNNPIIVQAPPVPVEKEIEIQIPEMMDIVDDHEIVPELNHKKEATILKYNSPLDHIQLSRKQPLQNPLLELCPYDLLGVCRDADCSYQHCSNIVITD